MSSGAAELEPVEDFLASRGIESLASRPVTGHDGQPVPLAEALAFCEPARHSIDAAIATIKDVGGENADVLSAMTRHVERMSNEAQSTIPTPQTAGAEKK